MSNILTDFRNDADNTVKIYNEGLSIVKKLGTFSPYCSLIGDTQPIAFGKILGEGNFGKVYDALFKGDASGREYVVKSLNADLEEVTNRKVRLWGSTTLGELASAHPNVSPDIFVAINNGTKDTVVPFGSPYYIPKYATDCLTTKETVFPNDADPTKQVVVPAGSYICDTSVYTEILNGLLLGHLVQSGACPHFVDTIDMVTCQAKKDEVKQYIFMEKLGRNMDDELLKESAMYGSNPGYLMSYLVQMAVAFGMMQQHYKMVHGDAHLDNILVAPITKTSKWNGAPLSGVDYFEYRIGGKRYYLPATPAIAKLADYGLTCKYSEPMILEQQIMLDGFAQKNALTGQMVPWIPNFYSTSYDLLYFCYRFHNSGHASPEISQCLAWMLGTSFTKLDETIPHFIDRNSTRPVLRALPAFSPQSFLLTCPVMKKYEKAPPKGKRVVLMTDFDVTHTRSVPSAIQRDDSKLIEAARQNQYEVVRTLLESGADPNTQDGEPLRRAIANRNYQMIDLLRDSGAKVTRDMIDAVRTRQLKQYLARV